MMSYDARFERARPGVDGIPFDMHLIQKQYLDGSMTPTKIISFGATANGEPMSTGCDMDLTPLAGVANTDGKQITDLVAISGYFETSTLNFRVPNLHKPGSAFASDVWCVVPTGLISTALTRKLHQGGVDRVVVMTVAFNDANDPDRATVVLAIEYTTCFMKFVDLTSFDFLTVFSFSFCAVKITQKVAAQHSVKGANVLSGGTGHFVWSFDYTRASSANGAAK
jgi:hypothetical protein